MQEESLFTCFPKTETVSFTWSTFAGSVLGCGTLVFSQGPVVSHTACVSLRGLLAGGRRRGGWSKGWIERKQMECRQKGDGAGGKRRQWNMEESQRECYSRPVPPHAPTPTPTPPSTCLHVKAILPGSYCRRHITSCPQVLSRTVRPPQRDAAVSMKWKTDNRGKF